MMKHSEMLTTDMIAKATPGEKSKYLFDGGGVYLEVMPNGSKLWRKKYTYKKQERRISLGVWPNVSLLDARRRGAWVSVMITSNRDPALEKKRCGFELIHFGTDDLVNYWNYYQQTLHHVVMGLFHAIGEENKKYHAEQIGLIQSLSARLDTAMKEIKGTRFIDEKYLNGGDDEQN
jgi:hypothetical protein